MAALPAALLWDVDGTLAETELHGQMAVHDQSDYDGLAGLVKRQNELNQQREDLELEWLETSDKLA